MSITLTHVSGPLKGQEQTFGDDRERVVIGRDASQCDVVFPPDATLVGREHCALVRQMSGEYELDIFGAHYVEVDGQPALAEAPVASGTTLTLGRHDGPRLKAAVDRSNVSADLSKTVSQQKVPSLWGLSKRTRTVASAAVALALFIAAGLAWQTRQLAAEKAESAALVGQMATLTARQKEQASQEISIDERDHLAQSVYAVVVRDAAGAERLLGTSWAVRPHTLATNAHVAAEFSTLKPGEALVVRPPGSADVEFVIRSATMHPGYKAFDRFVNDDALLVKNYGGWQRVGTIGGYDVALLEISETIPSSMILQVADENELASLKSGDPLAYAGFPYENIEGSNVQPIGRTPQVQVGNVTAMTDYFLLPAAFDQRHLVEHNLPATGGASGSPLVNSAGHVVGLLSAINITSLKDERIPSAAQINYGQRADVLSALLNGTADAEVKSDRAYWQRQTSGFENGADVVIANVINGARPEPNAKAVLDRGYEFAVTAADRYTSTGGDGKSSTIRYKLIKIEPAPGSRHLVIAYGKDLSPIGIISLVVDGKIVASNEGRGDPWAGINFTAPAAGSASVLVEVDDTDVDLLVRDYVWTPPAT